MRNTAAATAASLLRIKIKITMAAAAYEDEDLLEDDETSPFAANASNKLLDSEVCVV